MSTERKTCRTCGRPFRIKQSAEERFWAKVRKTDTCWIWTGGRIGAGYGAFYWREQKGTAHRASYELLVGPIPEGLTIDHLCGNKLCVNPQHLEPVTRRENLQRFHRTRKACKNGHPYNDANTRRDYRGGRLCRICYRVRMQKLRKAKAASTTSPQDGTKGPTARGDVFAQPAKITVEQMQ